MDRRLDRNIHWSQGCCVVQQTISGYLSSSLWECRLYSVSNKAYCKTDVPLTCSRLFFVANDTRSAGRYGTRTAVKHYTLFHTTTSFAVSRYPPALLIFLPEARKRKYACLISVDRTRSPSSSWKVVPHLHMKELSRVLCGWESIQV